MYKTNIVKAALYLRSPSPHSFPAPPRAPSLTLHARYYAHLGYRGVSLSIYVYIRRVSHNYLGKTVADIFRNIRITN